MKINKDIIGFILMLGGLIGILVCALVANIFYFENPDMTELRRFIECPWPSIGAIISIIATYAGQYMMRR